MTIDRRQLNRWMRAVTVLFILSALLGAVDMDGKHWNGPGMDTLVYGVVAGAIVIAKTKV